jgi:hypothetical protein
MVREDSDGNVEEALVAHVGSGDFVLRALAGRCTACAPALLVHAGVRRDEDLLM